MVASAGVRALLSWPNGALTRPQHCPVGTSFQLIVGLILCSDFDFVRQSKALSMGSSEANKLEHACQE